MILCGKLLWAEVWGEARVCRKQIRGKGGTSKDKEGLPAPWKAEFKATKGPGQTVCSDIKKIPQCTNLRPSLCALTEPARNERWLPQELKGMNLLLSPPGWAGRRMSMAEEKN